MSDTNSRNPFSDDAEGHDTISRLVQGAVHTHRQSQEPTRKRPRYLSEENRSKITVDLDPDTIAALREIARREGVGRKVSKVAQALLDYALLTYESGRLKFELRPTVIGYDLEAVSQEGDES